MNTKTKDFYSVAEFADLIGKCPTTIRRAIKAKRIEALRIGISKNASYTIPHSEINRVAMVDLEDVINGEVEKRIQKRKI